MGQTDRRKYIHTHSDTHRLAHDIQRHTDTRKHKGTQRKRNTHRDTESHTKQTCTGMHKNNFLMPQGSTKFTRYVTMRTKNLNIDS